MSMVRQPGGEEGECPTCGYDLSGLPGNLARCPECGGGVSRADYVKAAYRRMLNLSSRRALFYTSIVVGILAGVAFIPWYGLRGLVCGLVGSVWAGGTWLLWTSRTHKHGGGLVRAVLLGLPLGVGAFLAAVVLALIGVLIILALGALAGQL
ncbi:MAG TPA: hypothetical protein VHN77_12905 [Phycisphaerales bacterium]|nr:hypothetical protein [Phycisphaerales bacterium]